MIERITDTHVFFWGSEFSNWHDSGLIYDSLAFCNSEQAFMWKKAVFFGDHETAKKIAHCESPSIAKKLGRQVKNFDAQKWSEVSYQIMVDVNYAKYQQKPKLKELLLSTGDKIIVEASPYDTIWGIGLHWKDDDCLDETKWKGLNLLGKALMEVRNKFK
jgi:ribA/ribD-fused uncharacterized protein